MRQVRWAALSAAVGLFVGASPAQALIMEAIWQGDLDGNYTDTEGIFGTVGTTYRKTQSIPPIHYVAKFYYDTDLGVTTISPDGLSSTLAWNDSLGGTSPFLGADVTLNASFPDGPILPGPPPPIPPFNFLVGPGGSFSLTRGPAAFVTMSVGTSFGLTSSLPSSPGTFSIVQTDPLSMATFGPYGAAFPYFHGNQPHNHRLDISVVNALPPRIAALPEPSTWAMLIMGLGAVGGILRRRSALARVH